MLVLKNGHVLDPLNGIDGIFDTAVENDRIREIGSGIETKATDNVIDCSGCYVVPGLIDHHAHVQPLAKIGLPSEALCFSSGVTTVVDAGSTGCANYIYHMGILERLRLDIRAYLNVCTTGLDSLPGTLEDVNPAHWDRGAIRECFARFGGPGGRLHGLKLRTSAPIVKDLGYKVLEKTVELGDEIGVPVMVHCTNPPGPLSELLKILRPGDTITHMYMNIGPNLIGEDGKVIDAAFKARERGVLFEASDARAHFGLPVAQAAIAQGFLPDMIATDLTKLSMNLRPTSFSMTMQVSKYTALGIPFEKVIACATVNPARELGILDHAGSLTAGHPADVAVLRPVDMETVHGDRPYGAKEQHTFTGHRIYQAVLTLTSGEMVDRDMTF